MNNETKNRSDCIAILHGTHIGLLLGDPGTSKSANLSAPSVPLHLIQSFYDSSLDIKSSSCEIVAFQHNGPTFDESSLSEMRLSNYDFHSINSNKPGDFSIVQYPFKRETESAVVGDSVEIHVKRDSSDSDERNSYSLYLVKDSNGPKDTPFLQIYSPGYMICEMNNSHGYEQILFLPPPHLVKDTGLEKSFTEQKTMLIQIIKQCVLVDGLLLFCHSKNVLSISESSATKIVRYANFDTDKSLPPITAKQSCSPSTRAADIAISATKWQKILRKAVRKRFSSAIFFQKKQHHILQIHKRLNYHSRMILRNLSSTPTISSDPTKDIAQGLKMNRIKYTIEPVNGMLNSPSIHLHMEIDIALDTGPSHFLHNLHVSVSPKTKHDQKLSVCTRSGVIPTMKMGHCLRITALVAISGISGTCRIPPDNYCAQLLLSVFFSHDLGAEENMKSMVLSLISIPYKNTILKPNRTLTLKTYGKQGKYCKPTAIFDYHVPCSLSIDISTYTSNNIQDTWQKIVYSFNEHCTLGNCVDIIFTQQNRILLSIFASSPAHRLCVLQELLIFIPEDAQISEISSSTIDKESSKILLLKCIQKELTLSSKNQLSSGEVSELLCAQLEGDCLASYLDPS